jgi:hypothetical protein
MMMTTTKPRWMATMAAEDEAQKDAALYEKDAAVYAADYYRRYAEGQQQFASMRETEFARMKQQLQTLQVQYAGLQTTYNLLQAEHTKQHRLLSEQNVQAALKDAEQKKEMARLSKALKDAYAKIAAEANTKQYRDDEITGLKKKVTEAAHNHHSLAKQIIDLKEQLKRGNVERSILKSQYAAFFAHRKKNTSLATTTAATAAKVPSYAPTGSVLLSRDESKWECNCTSVWPKNQYPITYSSPDLVPHLRERIEELERINRSLAVHHHSPPTSSRKRARLSSTSTTTSNNHYNAHSLG